MLIVAPQKLRTARRLAGETRPLRVTLGRLRYAGQPGALNVGHEFLITSTEKLRILEIDTEIDEQLVEQRFSTMFYVELVD